MTCAITFCAAVNAFLEITTRRLIIICTLSNYMTWILVSCSLIVNYWRTWIKLVSKSPLLKVLPMKRIRNYKKLRYVLICSFREFPRDPKLRSCERKRNTIPTWFSGYLSDGQVISNTSWTTAWYQMIEPTVRRDSREPIKVQLLYWRSRSQCATST